MRDASSVGEVDWGEEGGITRGGRSRTSARSPGSERLGGGLCTLDEMISKRKGELVRGEAPTA